MGLGLVGESSRNLTVRQVFAAFAFSRTANPESGILSGMTMLTLEGWTGPWPDDDKDANFKADVAAHAHLDPLGTLTNLSNGTGIPVGALAHYVLCRWASEGSSALLELGPRMIRRLREPIEAAEAEGTDEARLAAYDQLRQMTDWLNFPLDHPEVYDDLLARGDESGSVGGDR